MAAGQTDPIERHLAHWAHAYGADFAPPLGRAADRPHASAAATAPLPGLSLPDVPPTPVPPAPVPPPAVALPTLPPAAAPSGRRAAPPARPLGAAPAAMAAFGADPESDRAAALAALRDEVLPCTRCKLHAGRATVVFGEGDPRARVMFVGEAPGVNEDRTGRPFVGQAGQLLDRILSGAMGLRREHVYIANINKCRPPGNRTPEADEVAACLPYLRRQVEIVRPEVLVCLGRTAAQNLLGTTAPLSALRGQRLEYAGIPVVVTWHPAYLLREPSKKRETWEDIKRVNRLLGLPDVPRTGGDGPAPGAGA